MTLELRNRLIYVLYTEHEWSLRALGKYFGLSHERIRIIVDKEHKKRIEYVTKD